MALDITRLSGGNTPADGSDPRTFPAIWNSTATALEGLELDDLTGVTVTSPTTGQVLEYNGSAWVNVEQQPGDNLIYNGAMQVAQRGTSETGITGPGYSTADRWRSDISSMGTWTQTVESDGPTGSGFAKSLKMECTTADGSPAASDYVNVQQRFEGQDLQGLKKGTSSAESLTLSFWVKSNATGTYVVEFLDLDNSRHISAAYTIVSSGTWEQKTVTLPGDTGGSGFTNDNGLSLLTVFWLGVGSDRSSGTLATSWAARDNANSAVGQTNLAASTSNYWQVTGVQLEAGSVATPFEHKSYGVELALCQRYYYVAVEGTGKALAMAAYESSSVIVGVFNFPVAMRVSPSMSASIGTDYYRLRPGDYVNSLLSTGSTVNTCGFFNNSEASGTAGSAGRFTTENSNSKVALDAEL